MNKEEIYSKLTNDIPNLKIYIDEPMKNHTTFKIGGNADIFIKATSINDVKYVLNFCKMQNIPLTIIGNGSNLLVKDNGIRGITLQIALDEINFNDYQKPNEEIAQELTQIEVKTPVTIEVQSGVKNAALASVAQKYDLSGLEFASGIPGTIGGAIKMNAGAYGLEFKDIIEEVTFISEDGELKTLKNDNLDFSYRHSRFSNTNDIIISCKLKLLSDTPNEIKKKMNENLSHRKEKQPIEFPSAGSTFKRGEDFITAKLIDDAGLKGYKIGGAQVSEKHAGFIINTGNATAKDVIELMEYVENTVYNKFGKKLEKEIEIIGE